MEQLLSYRGDYVKTETVSFDGQRGDVYTQPKRDAATTIVNVMEQVNHPYLPSDEMEQAFEQAELKVWMCADRYVHQVALKIKALPAGSVLIGLLKRVEITAHIYDLNTDIPI